MFCYLVVAPSSALLLSRRLWLVLLVAALAAVAATIAGLYVSFSHDLPTNQTIAVAACAVLMAAVVVNITRRFVMIRFLDSDKNGP